MIIHKLLRMPMNIQKNIIQQRKVMLIAFGGMTSDMKANRKLSLIVTELFLRRTKLNIAFVFIKEFYFMVPKTTTLNENSKEKRISANSIKSFVRC